MRGTITTIAALVAVLVWAPAALATIAPTPDSTWQTNGRVLAIAVSGSTVYLGGTFTEVEDHTGQTAVRNHVAAFNVSTGAVTSWAPNASGAVRAIVVSGSTSGANPGADLQRLFFLQLRVIGSTMGTRSELADLLTFVTNAGIVPQIGLELPLGRAEEGFRALAAGETGGKIVFTR